MLGLLLLLLGVLLLGLLLLGLLLLGLLLLGCFVREVEEGRWRCTGMETTGTAEYLNWIFWFGTIGSLLRLRNSNGLLL